MAGPGLPTNNDSTYPDSGADATVKLHQQHHDAVHAIVNKIDTGATATSGHVLIGDGTVFNSRALLSTDVPGTVISVQNSSYTLVISNAGALVEMNVAAANTLTVPLNSTVAFPVGTIINVRQYGAGTTTIAGAGGVTIRSRGGLLALAGQYAEATLSKRATDEWVLSGDLA